MKRRTGLRFEVSRVRLDRQGYDPHGRYWGPNTRGHKLYEVCVTDLASGTYRDAHLRAATVRDAKAQAAASMVKSLSGLSSRAA
ncbi:MAG TPA: hypothetical protein VJS18_21120 [Paraburkholderia sp.]|nr:hypothetical protein [Paraburkholderia sp.]